CHQQTEGHLRQMEIVASHTSMFIDGYSGEFESKFMKLLARRYPTTKVAANQVYNEYIKDRTHIHMNATQWSSLSEFVKYLGRESKCVVEETPKGWMITYINRDPETMAKQKKEKSKEKMEITDEEFQRLEIYRRLEKLNKDSEMFAAKDEGEAGAEGEEGGKVPIPTEVTVDQLANITPMSLKMVNNNIKPELKEALPSTSKPNLFNDNYVDDDEVNVNAPVKKSTMSTSTSTPSALDEIMARNEREKKMRDLKHQQQLQKDVVVRHETDKKENWIVRGLIIKVMDKESKFYKQKGVITALVSDYVATVQLLDSSGEIDRNGPLLKIDQTYLETVIPASGGQVRVLRGKYRGESGQLLDINIDKFTGRVQLTNLGGGGYGTITITDVPYEDFC
ncbi:hypothetical protein SAMD00019534_109720, partial [Acytostelium subglobosum LB1]|uniref:hypothetical protein n=1 Tax=Acytostelium subglobosum LB1 TaxID=1410327 RepID=UPI000644DEC3